MLLVDDDPNMCEMLAHDLTTRGYAVDWVTSATAGLARFDAGDVYEAVVSDLNIGEESGHELCRELVARAPHLPVVLITGFGSIEAAVRAIRIGAYDFITKPFEFDTLALTLERARTQRSLQLEVGRLRRQLAEAPPSFGELLGKSPQMRDLFRLLHRVSDTSTTALITGESGVGKELVARALHQQSRRKDQPFVAVNCGALPETLLESELFGHVKGAFTDARGDRPGVFREAAGGTLFLDEIGELPMALQPKLLRVLQERKVRPLGANREVPVDVRIVCATNVDLRDAVAKGKFREDLYYRLDVVHLAVPPLRSRGTDVLLLAEAFLARMALRDQRPAPTLTPEVSERLLAYDWPGNVRELYNLLERLMALGVGPTARLQDLPERFRQPTNAVATEELEPATFLPLAEIEKRYIMRVMAALKGNKRQAAETLGLDRSTLYRKLQIYSATESQR